jgi:tripartite-type tricarboxylate transporter receptor subunit TctC
LEGFILKLPRRQFLHLAAGAAALPAVSRIASADAYPSRPVHLLSGFPPGGFIDATARLTGQWLSERLAQPFVIENRTGASGNVATEAVVHSPPDGYTLLTVNDANAYNATLYDKLNFNFIHDIVPVASVGRALYVMVVDPLLSTKTVPEFIAYARANPGKINMASSGPGSSTQLFGQLFKAMANVDLVTVNYRGPAPALIDLMSGRVQVMFTSVASAIGYIKSGKLRALGVASAARIDLLPDVPPIGEFVSGYETAGWAGIGAPANTPPDNVATLNKQVNAALADATFKARLADLGMEPFANSPAEFGKFIVEYTERWGKVIRQVDIKPE